MCMGRIVRGTLFDGQPCVGTEKIDLLSLQLLGKERKDAEGLSLHFRFQCMGMLSVLGWRALTALFESWMEGFKV